MPSSGYYSKYVSEKDKEDLFFKICSARDGKGTGYRTAGQRRPMPRIDGNWRVL